MEIALLIFNMDALDNQQQKLFAFGALTAGISCLARADFNVAIFLFAYFIWEKVLIYEGN